MDAVSPDAHMLFPRDEAGERALGRLVCRLGARCFDEHISFTISCFPDEPGEVTIDLSGCGLSAAHERHGEQDGPAGRRKAEFGMVQATDVNAAVERMIGLLPRRDLNSRLPQSVEEQEQFGLRLCAFMRAALERGLGFSFSMSFPPLVEPRFGAHVYAPRDVRPSHRNAFAGQLDEVLQQIADKMDQAYPEPVAS